MFWISKLHECNVGHSAGCVTGARGRVALNQLAYYDWPERQIIVRKPSASDRNTFRQFLLHAADTQLGKNAVRFTGAVTSKPQGTPNLRRNKVI